MDGDVGLLCGVILLVLGVPLAVAVCRNSAENVALFSVVLTFFVLFGVAVYALRKFFGESAVTEHTSTAFVASLLIATTVVPAGLKTLLRLRTRNRGVASEPEDVEQKR